MGAAPGVGDASHRTLIAFVTTSGIVSAAISPTPLTKSLITFGTPELQSRSRTVYCPLMATSTPAFDVLT